MLNFQQLLTQMLLISHRLETDDLLGIDDPDKVVLRDNLFGRLNEFAKSVKEFMELEAMPVDKPLEDNKYVRLQQLRDLINPFLQEIE